MFTHMVKCLVGTWEQASPPPSSLKGPRTDGVQGVDQSGSAVRLDASPSHHVILRKLLYLPGSVSSVIK